MEDDVKRLLVLAPVSEYRGTRLGKVIARIQAKTPDLDIVTSKMVWHSTMPRKPAQYTHSEWRATESGFYVNWTASYRRELAKFADVLVIPRVDGTIGNGTRVDIKSVSNSRINVLLDDRLVPFTKVNKKRNVDDRVRNVTLTRAPEFARL